MTAASCSAAPYLSARQLRTTALLLQASQAIEQHYTDHRTYPESLDQTPLSSAGVPIVDGFGRPLEYEIHGKWLTQSYRVLSRGFDGTPSDDDLCVQGQTKLQQLLDTSATVAALGQALMSFKTGVPMQNRPSALQAVQCEHGFVEANPRP